MITSLIEELRCAINLLNVFSIRNIKKSRNFYLEVAGIGAGAELGDQFSVSQTSKTDAQMNLLENAVDIKVKSVV